MIEQGVDWVISKYWVKLTYHSQLLYYLLDVRGAWVTPLLGHLSETPKSRVNCFLVICPHSTRPLCSFWHWTPDRLSTISQPGITAIGRLFQMPWNEVVSKAHQATTGVHQGSVLGPFQFSLYTASLCLMIQSHWFPYHYYTVDMQLYLDFSPNNTRVSAWISACFSNITAWMSNRHLQLNLFMHLSSRD